MRFIFVVFGFLACFASIAAQSFPAPRQASSSSTADCNATCAPFQAMRAHCAVPHCGCTAPFLAAQGACLMCQSSTPRSAAEVRFLLDAEMSQCHKEGIKVAFHLDLPPAAAQIVERFDRESASLRRFQTAFLALQVVGGHVGLVVVLALAVLSRRVTRDPVFLNFCVTWIFSSVVFSLLLYRGTDGNTIANTLGEIDPIQCVAQAALTEGAQVMTACSTLALVVQLWLRLRAAIHGGESAKGTKHAGWMTCGLIVSPYLLFVAFALPPSVFSKDLIVVDGKTLQRVIPTNFYCTVVRLNAFLGAVYGVTLALLLSTMVFDVLIIRVLYKHWRMFRDVQVKSAVSLSILLRFMGFSLYRVVVAVAYGTALRALTSTRFLAITDNIDTSFSIIGSRFPIWVDMLQAAIPLMGFLILGVNRDMVGSCVFWRGRFRGRDASAARVFAVSLDKACLQDEV